MPAFNLLSLNTFGIPFFLSLGRIKRLASELNRVAPAVVCLQEIQQNIYVPLLEKHLTEYAASGFLPASLCAQGRAFYGLHVWRHKRIFPISKPGKAGEHWLCRLGAL